MTPLSIVHTENSCGWGGQEIRILTEARGFQDRGHRVTLVAPDEAPIAAAAERLGLPVVRLDIRRKRLAPLLALRGWIARHREQIDVLNTHSSTDSWLTALACATPAQRSADRAHAACLHDDPQPADDALALHARDRPRRNHGRSAAPSARDRQRHSAGADDVDTDRHRSGALRSRRRGGGARTARPAGAAHARHRRHAARLEGARRPFRRARPRSRRVEPLERDRRRRRAVPAQARRPARLAENDGCGALRRPAGRRRPVAAGARPVRAAVLGRGRRAAGDHAGDGLRHRGRVDHRRRDHRGRRGRRDGRHRRSARHRRALRGARGAARRRGTSRAPRRRRPRTCASAISASNRCWIAWKRSFAPS